MKLAGTKSKSPTWTDVKAKIAHHDRAGLLGLIHDLYAANEENRLFLHARFALGEDVLGQYKETLGRWLWPDVSRNQKASAAQAKQAIAHYRKAAGDAAGLAELMTFYCERAVGFCNDVGYDDASFLNALVQMFEQALAVIARLPDEQRSALIARLDRTRAIGDNLGYGVGDYMDSLLAEYGRG
jgi:hypothetical protein